MKSDNSIEVNNVKKSFKVYLDKGSTMKERVLFKNRRRYEQRDVLKGVSFEIKKGEAVGLIGQNGCGKSTTLKLLTRIMYPDSGTIELSGRVSSLIELGAGFHPDMSGRENIYINASIFGLTRKEIDKRLHDIIEFSELEDFIDNPVRTYSSGMYMRLAFSVAINVDADILLVDEILAVGDANFQMKCFNKMREIKETGTTIVLVSHALSQVEQICDRSIWINEGLIAEDGLTKDVHLRYMDYLNKQKILRLQEKLNDESLNSEERKQVKHEIEMEKWADERKKDRYGNGKAAFTEISFLDSNGHKTEIIDTEESCELRLKYEVHEEVTDAVFGYGIYRNDGVWCHGTNTHLDHLDEFSLREDGELVICFDKLRLVPGQYWFDITIETWPGIPVDYYKKALSFEVVSSIKDVGIFRPEHKWKLAEGLLPV